MVFTEGKQSWLEPKPRGLQEGLFIVPVGPIIAGVSVILRRLLTSYGSRGSLEHSRKGKSRSLLEKATTIKLTLCGYGLPRLQTINPPLHKSSTQTKLNSEMGVVQ